MWRTRILTLIIVAFATVVLFFIYSQLNNFRQSAQVISLIAVVPGCGNGIIEDNEECDETELQGTTCQSKGFVTGVLSCTKSCLFNVTGCSSGNTSSGGSESGGGTKKSSETNNSAQVVISGQAYLNSVVTVLENSQIVATGTADGSANFQIPVSGLATGKHTFSVYSTDAKGIRSALVTLPVTLSKGVTIKKDLLIIPPTIQADKLQVKRSEFVTFVGQSVPEARIEFTVGTFKTFTNANSDGIYKLKFNASELALGTYVARVQSISKQRRSQLSNPYMIIVGKTTVTAQTQLSCVTKGDLNDDCRVNLVDFSILIFWYHKVLSPAIIIYEKEHLSGDGKVDILDFSIMAFNWTG